MSITGEQDRDGFFLLDLEDPIELKDAVKEFLQTETGHKYKAEYYVKERSDDDLQAALDLARKKTRRQNISVNELRTAFEFLMQANVIARREKESSWQKLSAPPAPPEPEVPLDRNGHQLSASQLRWREFRIFVEGDKEQGIKPASMQEVNKRKRTDPEFRNFVEKNWERQLSESQKTVPDAIVPLNERTKDGRTVDPSLLEFAKLYLKEPIENLKPKNGFVTLGGRQITWTNFVLSQQSAAAAGLI